MAVCSVHFRLRAVIFAHANHEAWVLGGVKQHRPLSFYYILGCSFRAGGKLRTRRQKVDNVPASE